MKITEIYQAYKINQGLQEHMIRVAAVAQIICDHSPLPINREVAISACLLHDLGNLIKVNFKLGSELFDPEGIEYWKAVQTEMIEKYGDVETATNAMIAEAGVNNEIASTVKAATLVKLTEIVESGSMETKVLEYADMRVNLWGIVSLNERFEDIWDRYVPHIHTAKYIDELELAAQKIEDDIFSRSNIQPSDITDESTAEIQSTLREFDIPTQ